MSDYLKLLPAATQKEDIENLGSVIVLLPEGVVALLDEIDGMENGGANGANRALGTIRTRTPPISLTTSQAGFSSILRRAQASKIG